MRIVDLDEENRQSYFMCLEDWSDEMREAGDHKRAWYCRMAACGLRVKLALNDAGVVGGMIQYGPIEHSFVRGDGLFFIYCIWVHGHKQGRGDFRGQGMGLALLHAAEEDARARGAAGVAAWGIVLPFWMKASWFKKRGYRRVDRDGIARLLWKPFEGDADPPRWLHRQKKPLAVAGKVVVTAFINGWCPAQNVVFERAKRAALELGDSVIFEEYHTDDPAVLQEWGIVDGLFVDGRQVRYGPPPSYQKIKTIVKKRVDRLTDRA